MIAPVAKATNTVKTGIKRCPAVTVAIMITNATANNIAYLFKRLANQLSSHYWEQFTTTMVPPHRHAAEY